MKKTLMMMIVCALVTPAMAQDASDAVECAVYYAKLKELKQEEQYHMTNSYTIGRASYPQSSDEKIYNDMTKRIWADENQDQESSEYDKQLQKTDKKLSEVEKAKMKMQQEYTTKLDSIENVENQIYHERAEIFQAKEKHEQMLRSRELAKNISIVKKLLAENNCMDAVQKAENTLRDALGE